MCCPICKKETKRQGNPHRPFCSERCRLIDLDSWLAGRYHISSDLPAEEEVEAYEAADVD
ncbi:MAG: DNA gyrase inhibitor YacG [Terriglobia bacterium]